MPGIVCSSRAKQRLGLFSMHTAAVMRRMRNSVARLGTRYQLFFGSDPRSLGCNSHGDTRAPDFTDGRRQAAATGESSHAAGGRACKLIDLARSVGEQVGNAELGHDVDRLRDPIPPNAGQKLRSCARGSTGPSIRLAAPEVVRGARPGI